MKKLNPTPTFSALKLLVSLMLATACLYGGIKILGPLTTFAITFGVFVAAVIVDYCRFRRSAA